MKVLFATVLGLVSAAPNIVELAKSVDDLSTLVTAVVAGNLADTLSGSGPFTVFAPTNEAFAALSYDSLAGLLKPENKDVLVDVLKNHVLSEQVLLKDFDIDPTRNRKTLSGDGLSLASISSSQYRVCAVSNYGLACRYVTSGDNLASNGVVHIIDGVLVPGTTPLPNMLAPANIVGLAKSVGDLSTLVTAIVAGGLVDTLSSPGLFTVFAPTNAAFAALPAGTLASLLKPENKAELVDILTYHVLPQQYDSSNFQPPYATIGNFDLVNTVEGKPLHIVSPGGQLMVGANSETLKTVTSKDNFATNGIVHVIDQVLLPSAVASSNSIKLTSPCKGEEKGSFNVKDGVCYQLSKVPESKETSDQRIICEPNGDAYIIRYGSKDGTCTLPSFYNAFFYLKKDQCLGGASGIKVDCNPAIPNIVELAESVGDLSTLVAALVAGDLVDTLSSASQKFTVFAPTNEAFKALPAGTLDNLMKPENKKELVDILTYHVLAQEVLSTDLQPFQAVTTVEGKPLQVTKFGGVIRVGPSLLSKDLSNVTSADNLASNGVVHIINGVLIPPTAAIVV